MGTIPSLPYLHTIQLLNRAWSRVRDCRLWSWQLIADASIYAPRAITAGQVFAFYQRDLMRLDATAVNALQCADTLKSPPVAGDLGIGRQIRICGGGAAPNTSSPKWSRGNQWSTCPASLWGEGPPPPPRRRGDKPYRYWYKGVGWVPDPQQAPPGPPERLVPRSQPGAPAATPVPPAGVPTFWPIQVGSCRGGPYWEPRMQNGPNYTILEWDGGDTIKLDRPYGEPTVAGAPYMVYKCYYAAPAAPMNAFPPAYQPGYDQSLLRFLSLTNKSSGYTIRGKKLWYTQDMLNAVDPQRGATGDAYIIASYGRNKSGLPVFELYPHPVHQVTYYVTYWTRWPDVGQLIEFPAVPYGLTTTVMDLARTFAGQWAMTNVATKPELQMTNWVNMISMYKTEFKEGLIQCIKMDDEMVPARPFRQSSRFDFPLGGEFLQGHDVSSLIGWP